MLKFPHSIAVLKYLRCLLLNFFICFFKTRRSAGQTPYYFPEKFGKLIGLKSRPKGGGDKKEFMLTYEIDEVMTSMVTLQISADDIILIYNRSEK